MFAMVVVGWQGRFVHTFAVVVVWWHGRFVHTCEPEDKVGCAAEGSPHCFHHCA
jgi:hypothetical protein